ncbi:MAG: glutamate synthase large subunit, partial [Alphaproteobacteria bacterium]|nr:glutamate synthase large subunit [Alphaproteobacteria bacterium]
PYLDDLDLNPILVRADDGEYVARCTVDYNEVPETLDAQMIKDAEPLFRVGEKMQLAYGVRNTQRAIGAKMSSAITRKFGMDGLQPGHVTVRLRGSAGQSLGAWAVQGLKLEVLGDTNDYCGKGLSGGTIMLRPPTNSPLQTYENTIIGNVALYGATDGKLFAAGLAGDRFCVRNSGAISVVEGCGSNGCEYMTGGTAVILGTTGDNFAAGMTGGMAFVYDAAGKFENRVNADTVLYQRFDSEYWERVCRDLIAEHQAATQSDWAESILADWVIERDKFWQVVPLEMVERLEHPISAAPADAADGVAD